MRVKIEYTVDVCDEYRRAIRKWYGKKGKASRKEVKNWFRNFGGTMDADLVDEFPEIFTGKERNE